MKEKNKFELYLKGILGKIKKKLSNNTIITSFVFFSLLLIFSVFTKYNIFNLVKIVINDATTFFSDENMSRSPGDIIRFMGAFIGGLLVIWGLWINNKRVKEQNKQNLIAEKSQINTRFKDAAILLGSRDISSMISGIYALHQIAADISKDKDQLGFIEVIHNILSSFFKEKCNYKTHEEKINAKDSVNDEGSLRSMIDAAIDFLFGKHHISEKNEFNIEKLIQDKYSEISTQDIPSVVIQTIINVLFNEKDSYIYERYETDLSFCHIKNIIFKPSKLINVNFSNSIFVNITLKDSIFNKVNFEGCVFQNVDFERSKFMNSTFERSYLKDICFWTTKFKIVNFKNTFFKKVQFDNAIIEKVEFNKDIFNKKAKLLDVSLKKTKFNNVNFKNTFLINTYFWDAVLKNSNFDEAYLEKNIFWRTLFDNVTFKKTKQVDCDFTGSIQI